MLKQIAVKDFKSFADQRVGLAPLTLLVGPNASGKSNLFDAIRFLQGIGLDLPIAEILRGRTEGGREIWPALRGGVKEIARAPANKFSIETTWDLDGLNVDHSITCAIDPEPHVVREWLWMEGLGNHEYLFDTHAPTLRGRAGLGAGGALNVAIKRVGKGDSLTATYASSRSLLGQIEPREQIWQPVVDVAQRLRAAMRSALFLDISPPQMRSYVPARTTSLGMHGENISAVLYKLCQDQEHKDALVEWISELCAPSITNIEFSRTDEDFVLFRLIEKDGTHVSALSVSDGTLRFLGEIVAVMTLPKGSMLLIEEIENGLHPARAQLLVEKIEGEIAKGGRQVIATTHSPSLLSAVSKEHLGDVIAFGRSPDAEGTLMRQLRELPHFDDIESRRGIANLFTTKWLERAL
jgi:hypothetical protein